MLKKILAIFLIPISIYAQDAKKIHAKAIVADSHNDILTACLEKKVSMDQELKGITQSDLTRFKEGGVDVQIFSVWCDGSKINPYAWANRQMDTLYAVAARNPDKIMITKTYRDLKKAVRKKKLAAMFGVEGGHMIEDNIDNLDRIYERGARYMTLTWNNSTNWATSAMDETNKKDSLGRTHKGLTEFGKRVVKRMNELGMIVDLSHTGEQTFWDAIHATTKPVIISHSNAYALCPVFRNLKDDQIIAVGKNGGVIDINYYSGFVDSNFLKKDSSSRPPLRMILDHLDYMVKLAGVDHVGIGSDFDGITSSPQQLDDVTSYPLITSSLLERGYSKKDITKIMGGNILRVLKANEK